MRTHHDDANQARRRRIGPTRLALAALSAIAVALALPSPASAQQPELWATSPEDGAMLDSAPGEIAATFSGALDESASTITVTGPDQAPIEVAPAEFTDGTFVQPMRYTVPGDYTVAFAAVFQDGQSLDGSFTFSVATIPDMLYAEGVEPPPSTAEATEAAAQDSVMSTGVVVAAALFALLAAAAIGAALLRSTARRRHTEP